MGLTRLAIRRPLTILMAILSLVLMGGVAYTYLQVDRLPPVSIGVVSVSVSWPNASAENVERLVAEPLENAISGISGVDTITSNSSQGSASVFVQLVDGYDPNQADIDIQQAMGPVARQLPTGASAPVVRKFDPNASPILNIAFTGAPLDQLYDIASNQIQPSLASVPGVGQVNIQGGLQREIQVQLDYSKLAAYGLTVQQVSTALTQANVSVPSGSVPVGGQTINIVPQGLFKSVQDIQNVVITTPTTGGGPITIGNVATVQEGTKTQYSLQRLNGQDAVGLSITANSDANTVAVSDAVQADLKRLQTVLPQGTKITVVEDQSLFTRSSLDSIQRDLAIAVVMVALVILIFLHDWKHTAIVLCAIPTSLISTFLVMYALHFTLNTMSMMALALMIGILVDDSIVVLENIHRHLQLGESPIAAAINGRSEIGLAALAITACDVVVYTPVAFMSGSIGQLFRQYGLTVTAATIFSMLMSFTLTPMLASRWLRHGGDEPGRFKRLSALGAAWDRGFEKVGHFFAGSVPITLRTRWLVLLIGIGLVAAAGSLIPLRLVGTEYAPAEDDNTFEINLQLPPGTSLAATDAAARQMEGYIAQMPEVEYYFTSASVPGGGGFRGGASSVQIGVQTVDKSQRKRSVFDMMNVLRGQARNIPAANFSGQVASPLPGGGGGFGIGVTISGPDLNTVQQLSQDVQNTLLTVPGVQDVRNSSLSQFPQLNIQLNSQRMAQFGLTNQSVDQALSTAIGGTVVTEFQPPGTQQEDITLSGVNSSRYNTSTLGQVPIGVIPGTTTVVTLGQVASITNGNGPVTIQRVNRQNTVSLSASAVGRPLGDVANDMRSALNDNMSMPPGYSYQLRGSVQIFNQALTALGAALILAIILEYMLLVALYESWLLPFVRMLTVPLGLMGGIVLLWITGNTINIFSIIGMIMGEGLVAKSGILLIDYTNTLRERGVGRTEALQEAVRVRLRPILMTSATMIFGMLPLALKLEPGAETRAPMAIVVIGALLSSTFLTLVIVPALYSIIDDLRTKIFGAKKRAWETAPQPHAEPALAVAGAAATGNGAHGNGFHAPEHRPAAVGVGGGGGVPLNVVDDGDVYVVRAALPGIKQEDVEVSIHAHTLTIRGQRRGDEQADGHYVVQEYANGRWERSMALPQEVESAGVTARYEDGILELRLPKAGPTATRTVPIDGHGNGGTSERPPG